MLEFMKSKLRGQTTIGQQQTAKAKPLPDHVDGRAWSPWLMWKPLLNDLETLFLPKGKSHGFETVDDVEVRSRQHIKILRKSKIHEAIKLANKLQECETDNCCNLLACFKCSREWRRWIFDQEVRLLLSAIRLRPIHLTIDFCSAPIEIVQKLKFLTLVKVNCRYDAGDILDFNPKRFLNALIARLRACGLKEVPCIGQIDCEWNLKARQWFFHMHFTMANPSDEGLRELETRFYDIVLHPNNGKDFAQFQVKRNKMTDEDIIKRFSYEHKSLWAYRYKETGRERKVYTLPDEMLVECLLWKSYYTFADITFLNKVRRSGGELLFT